MKQRVLVIAGLAGLIVAAVVVVSSQDTDPTGAAKGVAPATQLWERLAPHQKTHLKAWRGAFEETPEPIEVLEAFNELGYAVTGPTGFWRKTVKDNWLGCEASADSAACKQLSKGADEFVKWDRLQAQISEVEPRKAKRFLAKHHKDLTAYLDRYVPESPSASGMEGTPFYAEHLEGALAGNAPAGEDDL